jgi:hypothetical protein
MKMKDFARNFDNKRTGCCITAMYCLTLPFSPGNFWPKTTRLSSPHPPYFSLLFPRLEIKLKGRHFDTIEVLEVESQAVLNTLKEHYFKDAFTKIAEALGTVHTRGR